MLPEKKKNNRFQKNLILEMESKLVLPKGYPFLLKPFCDDYSL